MTEAELIEQLLSERVNLLGDAVERACEAMLVTPERLGVLVDCYPDGAFRVSLSADVEPMLITYQQHDTAEGGLTTMQ